MSGRSIPKARRTALPALAALAITVLALAPGGPGVPEVRAGTTVNLDQWATYAPAWQNGNLNGNNTRYPEGGIVPFRLAIEGLKAGAHTITIQYDFTAGGHKAYDFLATYTGWVSPSMCGGWRRRLVDVPVAAGKQLGRLPVRRVLDRRSDGPRCRGIFGRLATADDLGRDDRVDHRPHPCRFDRGQQHRGVRRPFQFERVGRAPRPGVATWRSPGSGTSPRRRPRRRGRGLGCAVAHAHAATRRVGNKNQDRSIQPSAIVGELGPRALAPAAPAPAPVRHRERRPPRARPPRHRGRPRRRLERGPGVAPRRRPRSRRLRRHRSNRSRRRRPTTARGLSSS